VAVVRFLHHPVVTTVCRFSIYKATMIVIFIYTYKTFCGYCCLTSHEMFAINLLLLHNETNHINGICN